MTPAIESILAQVGLSGAPLVSLLHRLSERAEEKVREELPEEELEIRVTSGMDGFQLQITPARNGIHGLVAAARDKVADMLPELILELIHERHGGRFDVR